MIIGAYYWAFLVFGGVIVLLAGFGLAAQLQDQFDLGQIALIVAFGLFGAAIATYSGRALLRGNAGFVGVRAGPAFGTERMASRGCLFVILVVGAGLLLSGPIILIQVPGMAEGDELTFGIGALVSFALCALMVTPTVVLLWRRRSRDPSAAAGRLLMAVIGCILTFMVGGALLLTTFFDPRYDVGFGWQMVIGGLAALGAIGAAAFGVALSRSLR
ncbi:MAG TPA: hypothetical protein VGV88_03105 [Candidatus Dormibacteraeota bacterium]|nr:hypothetical protein [Candidatus Dormibacteraeota bacterium]